MRKISFTFLLAMLMSMVGTRAFAYSAEVGGIYYNLSSWGEATVTYYSETTSNAEAYKGSVVIPESIEYNSKTYSVTSIGNYAFRDCNSLTSVAIPSSVTNIGSSAFRYCSGLTSVIIPNSVMSIGGDAFYGCSSLTSVTIPISVSSIDHRAFGGCTKLTNVTLNSNSIVSAKRTSSTTLETIFGDQVTTYILGESVTSIGDYAFYSCSGLTSVIIPNSVTSIGNYSFSGCFYLKNVKVPVADLSTFYDNKIIGLISSYIGKPVSLIDKEGNEIKEYVIPEGVTSIGEKTFYNCSGLTSITIPSSVTNIGTSAFYGCSNLTSVKVSVTDLSAFCNNMVIGLISSSIGKAVSLIDKEGNEIKEYVIPEGVTSIGPGAFYNCSGLTSVTIPNSVTSIGNSAYRHCSGLTSVTIPNSVTSIGNYAFYNCSGLISVTIPSSVTSIGNYAFYNCSNLTNVKVPVTDLATFCDNKIIGLISISIGKPVSLIDKGGNEIKEYVVPEGLINIGAKAFYNCSGLTSVTIPSSVNSIGNGAFSNCTKLSSVTLYSNSIVSASRTSRTSLNSVFGNQVTNYFLGENVTSIGDYAFYSCTNLASVNIPNNVTSIGNSAFYGCTNLASVNIPNNVTTIGNSAFIGCNKLTSFTLPDNITSISSSTFSSTTKIYTKHKTKTLFSLWYGKYNNIYEQESNKSLAPPSLKLKTSTQTSLTIEVMNMYKEYTYEYKYAEITNSTIEEKNLYPEYSTSYSVTVKYNDLSYICSATFTTKSISPSVTAENKTASSATIKGSYTQGDANVTSEKLVINNVEYEGNEKFIKGLNPNTTYNIRYVIEVTYGENQKITYNTTYRSGYYTLDRNFKTEALTLTTKQPKVVSLGNVIVSAEANLDDEEKNVGFEWRRTDWTDDFESNTGTANMVEGTMEGYIRNLNTEKLWKFRPYYLADNGTYYYGDWVGVDPTNISFFEPTIHTYDKIVITGNTALVKGYALGGSDDVTVQGFKYWKSAGGGSNRATSTDIPNNAKTIEASGTVMEVSLSGLDYDSSYSYVAFATTSKGTYYGDIKTFETGNDPTGINTIKMDNAPTEDVHEVARFNMQGRRIATPEKGINIIKMSDGTTRKILVK